MQRVDPPELIMPAREFAIPASEIALGAISNETSGANWPLEHPGSARLEALQSALDEVRAEHETDAADVALAWDRALQAEPIPADEIALTKGGKPASWMQDVKDRGAALASSALDDGHDRRVWFIAGALIAAFGIGWAGGSTSDRLFGGGTTAQTKDLGAPRVVESKVQPPVGKGDSFGVNAPMKPVTETRRVEPAQKPAAAAPRPAPAPPSTVALAAPESAAPRPAAVQTEARAPRVTTPVPETKPASLPGWTVRDVRGGTATIEGPNGVWRAAAGGTVPGLGRVDFVVRWGGHWVVATSRGLVTTR